MSQIQLSSHAIRLIGPTQYANENVEPPPGARSTLIMISTKLYKLLRMKYLDEGLTAGSAVMPPPRMKLDSLCLPAKIFFCDTIASVG